MGGAGVNRAQWLITLAGMPLPFLAFAGLFFRRRARQCYVFAAYLLAVGIPTVLFAVWPHQFYRIDFWTFKEVLQASLKFGIALELSYRTFRRFPGALRSARGIVLATVLAVLAAVLLVPTEGADFGFLMQHVLPRILNGSVWLFIAISLVILWYRLPIEPVGKAILVGLVPYLFVFTVLLNAMAAYGWDVRDRMAYLSSITYLIVTIYWTWVAWRREPSSLSSGSPSKS